MGTLGYVLQFGSFLNSPRLENDVSEMTKLLKRIEVSNQREVFLKFLPYRFFYTVSFLGGRWIIYSPTWKFESPPNGYNCCKVIPELN